MTGTLLRTGNLKEFHPLGAVGNPVYLSASQLQSALRRRLGAPVANILAIPQRNEDGDTIDWYAPLSGPVVPWSAATPEERTRAKAELLGIREQIQETGEKMRGEENSERQIFGQLLDLVTTFPNDSHVYLVDGRPVITFWGFQEMNAPANSDPLLTLPEADESPAPPPPPVTEPPAAPADQPEEPKGRRFPWWWLLALLLLILLLLLALKMCGEEKVEAPVPESPPTEETAPSPEAEQPAPEEEKPPVDETAELKPDTEPRQVIDRVRDVDVVRDQVIVDQVLDGEVTGAIDPDQVVAETVTDGVATEGTADALETAPGEEPPVDADIPATEAMDAGETPTNEAPGESPQGEREQVPPEEKTAQESAQEAPEKSPEENPEKAAQEAPDKELPKDLEKDPQEGAEAENPKLDKDTQVQTPTPDPPESAAAENKPQGPLLQVPKDALKSGSTEFLDGRWSSSTSLMDSHTGRPIELEYAFQGGAGTVSLKRDGVVCKGKTGAAIKNGKLVISDTGNITCPDGAQYRGARVECRIDEQGRADCSGGYPSGDSFSTKIRKSEPTPAE